MTIERRPLKTRSRPWAKALALWLVRRGMSPNQMSVCSILAGAAGLAFLLACTHLDGGGRALLLLAAAASAQVRLLCNMLDGLMAVEGQRQTPTGVLFNEVPDRLADVAFLVGAGYASGGAAGALLGWLAACLALMTAYIRVLGGTCGLAQDYCGPQAKPHRMFVLTVACLCAAAESLLAGSFNILTRALVLIVAGSAITCIRRLSRISRQLAAKA